MMKGVIVSAFCLLFLSGFVLAETPAKDPLIDEVTVNRPGIVGD